VDGDTLELDGGEKVRLIGVNTPESVHTTKPVEYFGKEASAFAKRMAEGKLVRLSGDADPLSSDRYGRTLAYVYLTDGSLLNLEILRQGYGFAYVEYPFSRMEEFRAAEREAREQGRGLWTRDNGGTEKSITPAAPSERQATSPANTPVTSSCIPRAECCKICSKGQACGASCISRSKSCRKGSGCACDAVRVFR